MAINAPIGLYYGSNTGQTETVANDIAELLRVHGLTVDVHDVEFTSPATMDIYSHLILGTSTWHNGGPQYSWQDNWDVLSNIDFSNKHIACFGLGDSENYAEWYLDYMGDIYDVVKTNGGIMAGHWSADGYFVMSNKALTHDKSHYLGLALDNVNYDDLTPIRIHGWVAQLLSEWQ